MKITMEFARQDDCLDKMVPSDLRQLIGDKERTEEQCKALAAQVEVLRQAIKETMSCATAEQAKAVFKQLDKAFESTPAACLAQVRAEAFEKGFIQGVKFSGSGFVSESDYEEARAYGESIRQEVK